MDHDSPTWNDRTRPGIGDHAPEALVPVTPRSNAWSGRTLIMTLAPSVQEPIGAHELTAASSPAPERESAFESVTVIGPPPSAAVIAALAGIAPSRESSGPRSTEFSVPPARGQPGLTLRTTLARWRARVSEDFRRAPRSMRILLFALPIVAWAALGFGRPTPEAVPTAKLAILRLGLPSATAPPLAAARPAAAPARAPVSNVMRGHRTLEAVAADAAARGAIAEALELYGELAQRSPERPEFASIVRILRSKQAAR